MYLIKEAGKISFLLGDNKKMAKRIGLNNAVFSRILNKKQATRYTTAYCIVKLYDPEAEVEDYFDRIGD